MTEGCLSMTEQAATQFGKHKKWIMCPTCRQRTDLENVAFVVEKHSDKADKTAADLAEHYFCQKVIWKYHSISVLLTILSVMHLNSVVTAY
uniref:Uncharacterized protein n=1 Tax=Arundo donax TaxID=35708 RepID=A0A0A9DPL2_ARUDO